MSAAVIGSVAAALTTAATVMVAASPEAQGLLAPLTEGGSPFAATAVAMVFALPALAVLSVLVSTARD